MAIYGQTRERLIEKLSWRTEPINIQKVESNGHSIEVGKMFLESDEWLDDLKVTEKNNSDKVITRIVLKLSFPRSADAPKDASTYFISLICGADPADKEFDPLKQLSPGATAEIAMIKSNVPIIKEDLINLGYAPPVAKAQLKIDTVTFIDGSMWSADTILYPDRNNPRNKINPRHIPARDSPDKVARSPNSLSLWRLMLGQPAARLRFAFGV